MAAERPDPPRADVRRIDAGQSGRGGHSAARTARRMTARVLALLAPAALTLTITVATPTADAPVPAPESTLGFAPCTDYKLATSERISEYLHALDASSERLSLFEIGRTTEGRPHELIVISSERNLRQLQRFKEIARSL